MLLQFVKIWQVFMFSDNLLDCWVCHQMYWQYVYRHSINYVSVPSMAFCRMCMFGCLSHHDWLNVLEAEYSDELLSGPEYTVHFVSEIVVVLSHTFALCLAPVESGTNRDSWLRWPILYCWPVLLPLLKVTNPVMLIHCLLLIFCLVFSNHLVLSQPESRYLKT